jgi:hypothetical protein
MSFNADVIVFAAGADHDAIRFFTGLDEEFPNDDRLHVLIAEAVQQRVLTCF